MNFQVIEGIFWVNLPSLLILILFITIGTALSYYKIYGKYKRNIADQTDDYKLSLKSQIDQVFLKLLGFNIISVCVLYFLIILIFKELAKIEQLITLIKLWFVAEFALLMTRIKRDLSDQDLQQINQILGNFNLSTLSPVATGIQKLLEFINQVREVMILQDIEQEIEGWRRKRLNKIKEKLEINDTDLEILKEYVQKDLINPLDKNFKQKEGFQQEFDQLILTSEPLEIDDLCWLIGSILSNSEIKEILENTQDSITYQKLKETREESQQNQN